MPEISPAASRKLATLRTDLLTMSAEAANEFILALRSRRSKPALSLKAPKVPKPPKPKKEKSSAVKDAARRKKGVETPPSEGSSPAPAAGSSPPEHEPHLDPGAPETPAGDAGSPETEGGIEW